jgi:hypothetical protein
VLRVDGKERTVGEKVANQIYVRPEEERKERSSRRSRAVSEAELPEARLPWKQGLREEAAAEGQKKERPA